MNNWTAPVTPHENHRAHPYDAATNTPVLHGRPRKAKPRSNHNLGNAPTTPKVQFEMMCQELLGLIDTLNAALAAYKAVALTGNPVAERTTYMDAAFAVNRFIGAGYQRYVEPRSFYIEVVESGGFIISARIFGHPLLGHDHGVELEPFHSSSSYYSVYDPICP